MAEFAGERGANQAQRTGQSSDTSTDTQVRLYFCSHNVTILVPYIKHCDEINRKQ